MNFEEKSKENRSNYPHGEWIEIDVLEPEFRGMLTGEIAVEEGRFVRVGTNILRDKRLYTMFIAFIGFTMAIFFAFIYPLLGYDIEWISIGVSFIIGFTAYYITRKTKAPKVPEHKGMYFLKDRVIVFDNEKALVMLRKDLKMIHYGNKDPYISLFRHDNSRIHIPLEYATGLKMKHEFQFGTRKWIESGEPEFQGVERSK